MAYTIPLSTPKIYSWPMRTFNIATYLDHLEEGYQLYTRNGHPVIIKEIDFQMKQYPIKGYIDLKTTLLPFCWTLKGHLVDDSQETIGDIILKRP